GDQERTHTQADALASADEVPNQYAVDRVFERAARVALELDPIEVSSAGLIRRVDALDHQAFEATFQCVFEQLVSTFGIGHDDAALGLQYVRAADHLLHDLDPLEERSPEQSFAIAIHDVEDHRLERELGSEVADAVLSSTTRGLLKGQELLG